jgi:hypothetical protein
MSFHEQNIEAFIEVVSARRSLFSARDWASLKQLAATLPEDVEDISRAIASWYEKRSDILDAQLDALNELLTRREPQQSPTSAKALARPNAPVPQPSKRSLRQRLIEAIQKSAR